MFQKEIKRQPKLFGANSFFYCMNKQNKHRTVQNKTKWEIKRGMRTTSFIRLGRTSLVRLIEKVRPRHTKRVVRIPLFVSHYVLFCTVRWYLLIFRLCAKDPRCSRIPLSSTVYLQQYALRALCLWLHSATQ